MTLGILGPRRRRDDLDTFADWADVVWGVDSVGDALSRVRAVPIDVLVTDGSVAYLTPDLCSLIPEHIARIVAVCDDAATSRWAESFDGVIAVSAIEDIRPRITTTVSGGDGATTQPGEARHSGRVIAVWGPVGAPGATTVAISLAATAARAGREVVLCDADSRGSAIAIALGIVDEVPGLAAACRLAGRGELTVDEIHRLCVTVDREGCHFAVLTGLPRASRWVETSAPKVTRVIEALRHMTDLVVVDVGFGIEENEWIDGAPQRDGATRALIRVADAVVAVGSPDASGVARLIRGLDDLKDVEPRPIVILNAVAQGDARDATDAVERFTDHLVMATVPKDNRHAIEEAFARSRGQSDIWRDVLAVAGLPLGAKSKRRFLRG